MSYSRDLPRNSMDIGSLSGLCGLGFTGLRANYERWVLPNFSA